LTSCFFRLFSPEIRLLRSWIVNTWLGWVQALSTLSLITAFFAVIASLLVIFNRDGFKSSKKVLLAAGLHGVAGVLMFATVILFGVDGKRRDWMMNWQFNWFGWSFQLAIISCIIHLATAIMAGYQGSNRYELTNYEYLLYFYIF
jgi:ABC-type glycerol-3-phosphate transport system permease component